MRYTKVSYWAVLLNPVLLAVWVLGLRELHELCLMGNLRVHAPMILACGVFGILWLILWTLLYFRGKRRQGRKEAGGTGKNRAGGRPVKAGLAVILAAEIAVLAGTAVYYGIKIAETAVPYNGALSWKLDEQKRSRKVPLEHGNVFEAGVNGVFEDLRAEVDLPERMYFANPFTLAFDSQGEITQIGGFLYGKTEDGEEHTYLLDYPRASGEEMTVWLDGYVEKDYAESAWMEPMFELMDMADLKSQAAGMSGGSEEASFVLTYEGYETVTDLENTIVYRQDGEVTADVGEYPAEAYVVTLQMQQNGTAMNQISFANGWRTAESTREEEAAEDALEEMKQVGTCFMDPADESWYFYLTEEKGWRLRVHDAALGSRYYVMDVTGDGGENWELLNENPFGGQMGVVQDMKFYDEQYGYLSIGGASGSFSGIYVTRDGGATSAKVELPWEQVTGASSGMEYYGYLSMPEETGEGLVIRASFDSSGQGENIIFLSADQGNTWNFAGIQTYE